ncbi:Asp23/Gls24 family envelope stress response protein [Deinococcus maricopensis]|uniref:Asp23/Gls24 family envelope stress response protein n=1 Tax=Deinococcus maricopensis (strain DSM 21211 / LMG 22137 / NRRL B-23946 / LB-34) TaxID=709986 RepID=E8U953_DEIML|nr:Asp23/Gls24 family envelope stress response protein [Deinococcus maricopensis]ADV67592.1 protein of unknown function DUF322 [Deinococcus maricopensis DSM 21211]
MELDISKNVLLDIATTTLDRIEGLEVAPAPIKVGEVLQRQAGRGRPRAIKVQREGEQLSFDLGVNIEYGQNLVKLAQNAQRALTENVELMTGLKVRAVNVTVLGLTLPKGA